MNLCPNCLHKEIVGAFFCSECGAQLVFPEGVPTTTIKSRVAAVGASGYGAGGQPAPPVIAPAITVEAPVALNILNIGTVLQLKRLSDLTLGRFSEGQPVVPDVDLTPYKAFEAGVSRIHASLHCSDDDVTITDLGSANGTRVNGQQITSHIPYPVKHGDILTLGKFKIQILLRSQKRESAGP